MLKYVKCKIVGFSYETRFCCPLSFIVFSNRDCLVFSCLALNIILETGIVQRTIFTTYLPQHIYDTQLHSYR